MDAHPIGPAAILYAVGQRLTRPDGMTRAAGHDYPERRSASPHTGCRRAWRPGSGSTAAWRPGCYQRAIDIYHDIGNRHPEAETLVSLGETHLRAGDAGSARRAWLRAVEILDELGHASAAGVRARLADLDG